MHRTEPSQRQGLRSSPWRKREERPCQLPPPELPAAGVGSATATALQERETSSPGVPYLKKKNQAFQPKQSKMLSLQAQKKKFRVRGKLPGPKRRDKKRDGEGGVGW